MAITYGALPAHNGLWEAASSTHHDVLARLALVPMVLEARGLDTTPTAVARLEANGDVVTAAILEKSAGRRCPMWPQACVGSNMLRQTVTLIP